MKQIALFLMLMLVPACTSIQTVTSAVSTVAGIKVPQNDVAAAVVAFNAAEKAATRYLLLPTCKPPQTTLKNACKTQGGVALLGRDVPAGRAARDELWAASKADPSGAGPKSLVTAVIAAVSAINQDTSR